ncbi:MAG TPA: zinc-binding alcohol dehydrogenase family protein [Candidatus Blautia excrementipullorum]|nr:zinc-binding alcohol dehydrogenase family protein [Candidatus Blautia excrementipullorum]
MKQIVITKPGEIKIEEVPIPEAKAGEALLQVQYCGICGADVASYTGNQPFTTYPRIPGHEFSARIVTIPENTRGLKPGDLVTANPYFNCGTCYSCRRGYVNCCEDNQTMGVQRDGSFRQYITMPVDRILPAKGLGAKELALIEPFSISYHAVSRCEMQSGSKVLVIGAGPIGLFALIAAKQKGAFVYVSDVLDGRLERATRLGASGTVNPGKEDIAAWTRKITDSNGFDICIEACGHPETFLTCIEQAAFAGKVVLIGNGKKETTFVHSILLKKELNVYGSRNSYTRDFEVLIDWMAEGNMDVTSLISAEYPFEQTGEAMEALVQNDGSLEKVLIRFDNAEEDQREDEI